MSTPAPSKKNVKVAIAIGAAILLTGGLLLIVKYMQASKTKKYLEQQPDSVAGSTASKPIQATTPSSVFPLKNGSAKSSLVAQLQTLLGVNADGLFGPKTEAALYSKTGKKVIASQSEYDSVIGQLKTTAALIASQSRGNDLITKWKSDPKLQLTTNAKTYFIGVSRDAYGALTTNGKNITMEANSKLSRTDYIPDSISTNGFLVFSITSGSMAGLYKTDVTKMTVS